MRVRNIQQNQLQTLFLGASLDGASLESTALGVFLVFQGGFQRLQTIRPNNGMIIKPTKHLHLGRQTNVEVDDVVFHTTARGGLEAALVIFVSLSPV
jgi:hypothetical protein